jgi:hypothetical protein
MKIAAIKKLIENYTLSDLKKAEELLEAGEALTIDVEGDDEGEQFTHILGAIDILTRVEMEQKDANTALREFTQRVRNSIN